MPFPNLPAPQQAAVDHTLDLWAQDDDWKVLDHHDTELPEGWVLIIVNEEKGRPRKAAVTPDGTRHRVES
jgi:hypothetical protein